MRLKLGLLLLLIFISWRGVQLVKLSFFNTNLSDDETNHTAVAAIQIPKVNLNLNVVETTIKNGVWEIPDNQAGHLEQSLGPGDGGNIVLYAHNKTNLFGPIRWLNIGDKIILLGDNQEFSYQIIETRVVSPTDISYILPKDAETLTLFTCTGLFDSQRFVVVAKPV